MQNSTLTESPNSSLKRQRLSSVLDQLQPNSLTLAHDESSSDEDEIHEHTESHYKLVDDGTDDINTSLNMIRDAALEEQKSRGRKKKSFVHVSDPKKVTVEQRVREFQGEPFSIQGGNLYCDCCCSMLPRKYSSIKNHIKSKNHLKKRESAGYHEHSVIYHQIIMTERNRQSGASTLGLSAGTGAGLGFVPEDLPPNLSVELQRRALVQSHTSLVSSESENDFTKELLHLSYEQLVDRASVVAARNEELVEKIRTHPGPTRAFRYTLSTYIIPNSDLQSQSSLSLLGSESSLRFSFHEQLVDMGVEDFRRFWTPRHSFPKFLHVPDLFNDRLNLDFRSLEGLCSLSGELIHALQKCNLLELRPMGDMRRLIWALQLVQRHLQDAFSHFIPGAEDSEGPASRLAEIEDSFLPFNLALNDLLTSHGIALESPAHSLLPTPVQISSLSLPLPGLNLATPSILLSTSHL